MIRWQGLQQSDREHLILTETEETYCAESIYISGGGADSFAVSYRLVCHKNWTVKELESRVLSATSSKLVLHRSENGVWHDGASEFTELAGAIDIDLSITPFTNTLPIRRLMLGQGQSADINVAYVAYPEHHVMLDPQRYTCLDAKQYRFESVDTDFVRDIEVDDRGLVTFYPGMFARI